VVLYALVYVAHVGAFAVEGYHREERIVIFNGGVQVLKLAVSGYDQFTSPH
jgi:hypothetical protein